MPTRTNISTNPALKVDAAGWGGGGATRVTGVTGLSRTTAWQSGGVDVQAPKDTVTPGATYRFSAEVKGSGGASTGTCNINFYLGGSYVSSSTAQAWTVGSGDTTRVDSLAVVAPGSGIDSALLTIEGIDNPIQVTAVLYEQHSQLSAFFDGDSPSGKWTGTAGNSTSTIDDYPSPHPTTSRGGFI